MDLDWKNTIVNALLLGGVLLWAGIMIGHFTGIDLYEVTGPLGDAVGAVDEANVPFEQREILYLVMGVVFGFVGLNSLERGLPAFDRAQGLWSKDPIPVGDLHLVDGAVEIEGVAEPMAGAGTIGSKYTGTECLAFKYETKERRHRTDREDTWQVVERGSASRPFHVTDDSGTIAVDPDEATFSFDRDIVVNSGRRIQTEWRLEPGESVYVSGRKLGGVSEADAPGDETTYIGAGDEAGAFTISDASEYWTVLRFVAKGTVLSLVGLLFVGVGAGLVYVVV